MIIAPVCIGDISLSREELEKDRRGMVKVGPCGVGEKAVYLNGFFIDRRFYAVYPEIDRIFKRVAMSKGGFSGKGIFGSIPYLVVLLKNGQEKQCNFKYEDEVDRILQMIRRSHPEIPVMSEMAEKRVEEARRKEEARYLKELSIQAEEAVGELERARSYLEEEPRYSDNLSFAARQKRVIDCVNPMYRYAAVAVFLLSLGAMVFGIISISRQEGFAVYFLLFGMAFMFYTMSSRILPTGRNNRAYGQRQWDDALRQMRGYVGAADKDHPIPVPPQYAHPATLSRMIRVIREGRAQTVQEAWRVMKTDLKEINRDVTVSQEEYDEIVSIKPMFILCEYRDELQETYPVQQQ